MEENYPLSNTITLSYFLGISRSSWRKEPLWVWTETWNSDCQRFAIGARLFTKSNGTQCKTRGDSETCRQTCQYRRFVNNSRYWNLLLGNQNECSKLLVIHRELKQSIQATEDKIALQDEVFFFYIVFIPYLKVKLNLLFILKTRKPKQLSNQQKCQHDS